jgi:hypothetical protein
MLPRVVVVIGWALGWPLLFAGCGDRGFSSNPTQGTPTGIQAYEPDAADAGVLEDATAPVASPALPYQGSSLCRASRGGSGCYPDDMINACDFTIDPDAPDGAVDAGFNVAPACHVVAGGLIPQTTCLPSTVPGMYASTCANSTECSPGYECVAGGTCRHYCCAGNSACSENQFCDVQPMAESPQTLVPVCLAQIPCVLVPLAACSALSDGCPPSDQCSVVRDDGATSCVAVGTAQDGDLCEQEHCARGLVCLGPLGSRRCEPLCCTADPSACKGSNRTCIGTLPLFPNPTVGACQ